MCDACVKIDTIKARYQRLKDGISDEQTRFALKVLLSELETKKVALHPR